MGEGVASLVGEGFRGEGQEGGGAWAAYPAGEGGAGGGVRRPPDRRHLGGGEEEAEFRGGGVGLEGRPEAFAEDEGEAADLTHLELAGEGGRVVGSRGDGDGVALEDGKREGD